MPAPLRPIGDASGFQGLDAEQARDVAFALRTMASTLRDLRHDVQELGARMQASSETVAVHSTLVELRQETSYIERSMDLHADLIDAADRGMSNGDLWIMASPLFETLHQLSNSLDDGRGASGSPSELREFYEQQHFDDGLPPCSIAMPANTWYALLIAAPILERLTRSKDIAAFWDALEPNQRLALAEQRPDLVVEIVERNGVELKNNEVNALRFGNRHVVFTSEAFMDATAGVQLRVVTIQVGGELSLTFEMLSNGNVKMISTEGAHAGIGLGANAQFGEAAAHVGGIFEAQQVFMFPDEAHAALALADIQQAFEHDRDQSLELAFDSGLFVVARPAWQLKRFVFGGPTLETPGQLASTFDKHGVSHTEGIGAFYDWETKGDLGPAGLVGRLNVELEADARAKMLFYDTDTTHRTSDVGQTGMILSGVVSVDAEATLGELPGMPPFPSRGSAQLGLLLDTYRSDDGIFFTRINLTGDIGVGASHEFVDQGGFDVDGSAERVVRVDYSMTVPVNARTIDSLESITNSAVRGQLHRGGLDDLWDASEVTIVRQSGERIVGEAEGDFAKGTVNFEAEVSAGNFETDFLQHKRPDGEMVDQLALGDRIDRISAGG